MGRPINKKYFGDPSLNGKQLTVSQAWFADQVDPVVPGDNEDGTTYKLFLTKQVGTGRFNVRFDVLDTESGNLVSTQSQALRLVKPTDLTGPGLAVINVEPVVSVGPVTHGTTEHARVLFNRTVKTWEGNRYTWSVLGAAQVGDADLPLA
jgi:hypothetical protein